MNTAPLSNNSWQYRELNSQTPSLNALSDALIEPVSYTHLTLPTIYSV